MRRSEAHEYRQAYNAQAVVCADGSQLILATNLVATTADAPSFAATVLAMQATIGLPQTVLADTGYASGTAVEALQSRGTEPLVAIGRTQPHRPYDFCPPPKPKAARWITEPWRIAMKAKLETEDGKECYKKRKSTVEPVFGIIKRAMGFTHFHLRGSKNVGRRMDPDRTHLQLQVARPPEGQVITPSRIFATLARTKSDRLIEQFGWQ